MEPDSSLDDLFLWDQALNTERLVLTAALEQAFISGTTNDGTPMKRPYSAGPMCDAAYDEG
jgi:hypothetical protein